MRVSRVLAAAAAISLATAVSAEACVVMQQPELTDALQADAVVVGYVTDYELETAPQAFGRARLTVEVDHALSGTPPPTITVYWLQGLNNGPPTTMRGGFLFVLRKPDRLSPPMAAGAFVVESDTCTPAMVFRRGSPGANAIREIFGLWPEPLELPRKTLAEFFAGSPVRWPTLIACAFLALGAVLVGLIALWPRRPRALSRVGQDRPGDRDSP